MAFQYRKMKQVLNDRRKMIQSGYANMHNVHAPTAINNQEQRLVKLLSCFY